MAQARRAPRAQPRGRSDLLARILVAVPAAILAIVFVDLGGIGWTIVMAVLACACLNELYPMLSGWRPVPVVGFAVAIGMCLAAYYGNEADMVGVGLTAAPLTFLAIVARGQSNDSTLTIASTLLGVFWIAFAFGHAVLLRDVTHGDGVMIDVMLGTFLGDTAAYLGGRMFGRHPLAPAISPKKTIEGLGCGALVSVLAIVCAGLYQPWMPHGTALLLGIAVAILGPMGDLFESIIKRDAGTKDAGSMFGAHGGALDRLDAIMFTVVVGYYIWTIVPR